MKKQKNVQKVVKMKIKEEAIVLPLLGLLAYIVTRIVFDGIWLK